MKRETRRRQDTTRGSRTQLGTAATAVTVTLALLTVLTGSVGAVTQGSTLATNETTVQPRTTAVSAADVPAEGGSNAVSSDGLPRGTLSAAGVGIVVGIAVAGMIVTRREGGE